MSYKTYVTKDCQICKKHGLLTIWENDFTRYLNGATAEDAFSDLLAPVREQIISGTHPECWIQALKDDDGQ